MFLINTKIYPLKLDILKPTYLNESLRDISAPCWPAMLFEYLVTRQMDTSRMRTSTSKARVTFKATVSISLSGSPTITWLFGLMEVK
jgi:hypothetical protein